MYQKHSLERLKLYTGHNNSDVHQCSV